MNFTMNKFAAALILALPALSFALPTGETYYETTTENGRVVHLYVGYSKDSTIFQVSQVKPALKNLLVSYEATILGDHNPQGVPFEYGSLKEVSTGNHANSYPIGKLVGFNEPLSKQSVMLIQNSAGETYRFVRID